MATKEEKDAAEAIERSDKAAADKAADEKAAAEKAAQQPNRATGIAPPRGATPAQPFQVATAAIDGKGDAPGLAQHELSSGVAYARVKEGFVAAGYRWNKDTYFAVGDFERLAPGQLHSRMESGSVVLYSVPPTA